MPQPGDFVIMLNGYNHCQYYYGGWHRGYGYGYYHHSYYRHGYWYR
jgi:hypothetical protein